MLQTFLLDWASAGQLESLVLYLTGNGIYGGLRIDDATDEVLTAQTLDDWLDDLQQETGCSGAS